VSRLQRHVNRAERRLRELKADLEDKGSEITRDEACDELRDINAALRRRFEDPATKRDDPGYDAALAALQMMDILEGACDDRTEVPGRYSMARRVGEVIEGIDQAQGDW
jgi:hypothetical protein